MGKGPEARSRPPRYRLFGITMETAYALETRLPPTEAEPDLTFTCETRSPGDLIRPAGPAAFDSPVRLNSGAPFLSLFRLDGGDLLRFTEVADFLLSDDRITCHLVDETYGFQVEVHLLGIVFAYWFERQGVPMLHAATVEIDGKAVGFMATNKGGKSSLAASLMELGHPLLSDDLVGIQFHGNRTLARPGFPSMRLWPDQASWFTQDWSELPLAHPTVDKRRVAVGPEGFGTFRDECLPLDCLYLPERRSAEGKDARVELRTVPPREAVIELVRGSFLPRLVEGAGLAPQRLASFGRLATGVPVRRFLYPEGVEHLPAVGARIIEETRAEPTADPKQEAG